MHKVMSRTSSNQLSTPVPVNITATLQPEGINAQEENCIFIRESLSTETVIFTITNLTADKIKFDGYNITCKPNELVSVVADDEEGLGSGGTFALLKPQESYLVQLQLRSKSFPGSSSIPIRMRFNFNLSGGCTNFVKVISYDVISKENQPLYKSLAGNDPTDEAHDWSNAEAEEDDRHLTIIWLERDYSTVQKLVVTLDLSPYILPYEIGRWARWPVGQLSAEINLECSWTNYLNCFDYLLYFDECQCYVDIDAYTKRNQTLYRASRCPKTEQDRFLLKVPGLLEKRPSLMIRDRIFVTPMFPENRFKYEGEVNYISQSNVYFVFNPQFSEDIDDIIDRVKFKVQFRYNRLNMRLMHRAVELAQEHNLESCLFPSGPFKHATLPEPHKLKFYDKRIEQNKEQKTAVRHIVKGTSSPAPYIIYGPPGTGKTVTLVEAIKQVYAKKTNTRLLVCAPANDPTDLIASQLLNDIPESEILRLNASARSTYDMNDKIKHISNSSLEVTKEEIMEKRIVLSTLTASGRLVSAEIWNHFTHIFIDEAGFATEPETLIPLSLLNADYQPPVQLILAGDPKQLGPVIRSPIAEAYNLGTSLLKRLMDKKDGPYTPDDNNKYNPNYVTKLVNSFRSHPAILKVPNERFYNGELVAKADKNKREMFCTWKHLPDKAQKERFPLIFHGVKGREAQEKSSPSWMNLIEVLHIKDYVEKLLMRTRSVKPEQIGIISPYHKQVSKIRRGLREALGDKSEFDVTKIKVGSVEKFQGDEREIILISTVRSTNPKCGEDSESAGLGFLVNEKRFNVAATRAKALLIVVGNPVTLCRDGNWRSLIMHILNSGGYTGEPKESKLLKIIEDMPAGPTNNAVIIEGSQPTNPRDRRKQVSVYQRMADDEWHREP